MSQVAEIIERIRDIAKEAAKIDADLDNLHGIDPKLGIDYFDTKAVERRYAANTAEVAMEEYLNSLDEETVRRIEAVMYSGRGDGSVTDLREQLAENHSSKEDIVGMIVEKRVSFDAYFDRGLDRAKADGIDLDTF